MQCALSSPRLITAIPAFCSKGHRTMPSIQPVKGGLSDETSGFLLFFVYDGPSNQGAQPNWRVYAPTPHLTAKLAIVLVGLPYLGAGDPDAKWGERGFPIPVRLSGCQAVKSDKINRCGTAERCFCSVASCKAHFAVCDPYSVDSVWSGFVKRHGFNARGQQQTRRYLKLQVILVMLCSTYDLQLSSSFSSPFASPPPPSRARGSVLFDLSSSVCS
ncbi:hypothetical protein V8C44DRAFT_319293, partial [Trichoderma aethiopicum]